MQSTGGEQAELISPVQIEEAAILSVIDIAHLRQEVHRTDLVTDGARLGKACIVFLSIIRNPKNREILEASGWPIQEIVENIRAFFYPSDRKERRRFLVPMRVPKEFSALIH